MTRKLIAAIACRNQGSRLYGKPLQNLDIDKGVCILDNIIDCLESIKCIDEIVLGISEGVDNEIYRNIADDRKIKYIVGDQIDVLSRLIKCGKISEATDIFRVTSESPFLYFEPIDDLWIRHQLEKMDVTFLWNIIDGSGFEIYTLNSLLMSHNRGLEKHRSEMCSLYVREHPDEFKVLRVDPPPELIRKDLRLTVDYPEDLVVCRAVYKAFQEQAPRISVYDIVKYLDNNPKLKDIIAPYTEAGYSTMDLWVSK